MLQEALLLCLLSFVASQNPLIHYPCGVEGFYQARRTEADNWWVARMYLNEYDFTGQVQLIVKVDSTATVDIDPRHGHIDGPRTGQLFHLHYSGTPQNTSYVEFRVKGTEPSEFPNLIGLNLNHRDICHRPKQWVNNQTPRPTMFSTSLLGGFLTTEATGYASVTQKPHAPAHYNHQHNHDYFGQEMPISEHIHSHNDNEVRPSTNRVQNGLLVFEGPTSPPRHTSTTHRPILAIFTDPSFVSTQSTRAPTRKTTRVVSHQQASDTQPCGRKKINSQSQAFITNGWKTKPGDWPWHTAIYHKNHRSSEYKCGGTLINKGTVLTAAHCLYSYGKILIPDRVSVQLGKYDLNRFDSHSEEYGVYHVIVHPNYSSVDYTDDIGILKLAEQVMFTDYIQPICLWKADQGDLNYVVNKVGTVAGWGLNEKNQKISTLSEARMPVVDFHACLESDRDFFGLFLSDYNFCAGFRNGTSVCQGDSGGGMYFDIGGSWYLRGLVSHGTVIQGTNLCNPRNFVIFTDVAKYRNWITSHW